MLNHDKESVLWNDVFYNKKYDFYDYYIGICIKPTIM